MTTTRNSPRNSQRTRTLEHHIAQRFVRLASLREFGAQQREFVGGRTQLLPAVQEFGGGLLTDVNAVAADTEHGGGQVAVGGDLAQLEGGTVGHMGKT